MLISPTLSLSLPACFFFFLLLSDHLSREEEAGKAGTCAVMCSLYDGAEEAKKKYDPGPAANEIYSGFDLFRFTLQLY